MEKNEGVFYAIENSEVLAGFESVEYGSGKHDGRGEDGNVQQSFRSSEVHSLVDRWFPFEMVNLGDTDSNDSKRADGAYIEVCQGGRQSWNKDLA